MNIEKKLEYFTAAIDREVESKKRQARKQMAADADKDISAAVAASEAEALAQNQPQIQAIQKAMNKRINEAETEARRSLINLQERLVAQLFDGIKAEVISFTQSPEYESLLISNIQAATAISRHSYTYIQLAPRDMSLAEKIQAATGLTPEVGDDSFIGGFKLQTESRNIIQEHTLSASLTEARKEFSAEL